MEPKGESKSDSKLDSKAGKRLILLAVLRKQGFYQLNYSRSVLEVTIFVFNARSVVSAR